MKLKKLEIELQPSYRDNGGKYIATVEYEDHTGAVKVILEPGISENLLAFIGPVIAKFTNQAAQEIERNLLASVEEARRPMITMETV